MKIFFVRLICCFIPISRVRRKLRNWFLTDLISNKIIVIKNGKEYLVRHFWQLVKGLNIQLTGQNNIVKLHLPFIAHNSCIKIFSNNSYVEIGSPQSFDNTNIIFYRGAHGYCKIGSNLFVVGADICLSNSCKCLIGNDCLFSKEIMIYSSDLHSVIDINTKQIINKPTNALTIGNHCWIGRHVAITKNAVIPDNSIIGIGSVVSQKFIKENTVIAGNPAKVVKINVNWNIKDICEI
jgi:acetyltransferase-like isoleucine patch superfamily enzyme